MEIKEESSKKPLRNTKDSVFGHLFSEPDYLLRLYKTLHPEDVGVTERDLELCTLQNIIVNGIHNDLGFLVKDKLLILAEAQSTWSPNIIIRSLIYLFSTYQQYIFDRDIHIYGTAPVKMPKPEIYVIYTGERKNHPDVLSLKEICFDGDDCDVEGKARVIYLDDSNTIINQYILFSIVWTDQVKVYGLTKEAITNTIRICKERNILREYLERKELEVEGIMLSIFSQERVTRQYGNEMKAEGKAEGKIEGKAEGKIEGKIEAVLSLLKSGIITEEEAAKGAGMTVDAFRKAVAALA